MRHSKEVHVTSTCLRCSKVFKYKLALFEHMNAAHLKIRRPYKCSECPGDWRHVSKSQLTDHLRTVHSKRIKRGEYFFEKWSASFVYETDDC